MRYVVLSLILTLVTASAPKEWYSGGTLHKKTGHEWLRGSPEDRLATAADFSTFFKKPASIAEMLINATNLELCISKSLTRPKDISAKKWQVFQDMPVTEMAAVCGKLLFKK